MHTYSRTYIYTYVHTQIQLCVYIVVLVGSFRAFDWAFVCFLCLFAEKPVLERFLYSMFGDVESAQRLLELNDALRNKYPHIFLQRDPTDQESQQLLQVA